MKSHRKHKPLLPTEREAVVKKRNTTSESRKVRLDRLAAAERAFWWWFEAEEASKAQAARCTLKHHEYRNSTGRVVAKCWHGLDLGFLRDVRKKYDELWTKAKADGIV